MERDRSLPRRLRRRKCIAEYGFHDEPIGRSGEAVPETELHIDRADTEITDTEQRVLLLRRRRQRGEPAPIAVVLDCDIGIRRQPARDPHRGREVRLAVRAEADIHDRIEDRFPAIATNTEDRADLEAEPRLREARRLVAALEVDPAEERAIGGMRGDEQRPHLEAVAVIPPAALNGERRIEADLPPVSEPVGRLRRAVQRMVRRQAAGKAGWSWPSTT